jgi:hypothetical protein
MRRAHLVVGVVTVAFGVLVAGCSNTRRCETEPAYEKAGTLPTPGEIQGLTIPESPSALRIPAAPADPVPFGRKLREPGRSARYECLDTPPAMTITPEPPPAATPAPAQPNP